MKKSKQISESFMLAVLLTLSGGLMDAYSYICRGHVFANAQTGNILLFGVNIATGDFSEALRYLCPILAFAFGIGVADIIKYCFKNRPHFHWRQLAVLMEVVFLVIVAFIPQKFNLLANSLASFACGIQVESFRKINGSGVATTMCIGNLRSAVQSISDYHFTKDKNALERGFLYISLIFLFTVGAVIGNFSVSLFAEKAIIVSSLLLFIGFLFMIINKED